MKTETSLRDKTMRVMQKTDKLIGLKKWTMVFQKRRKKIEEMM